MPFNFSAASQKQIKNVLLLAVSGFLTGCSIVGQSDVATAPYTVVQSNSSKQIEIRQYEPLVLVSSSMSNNGRNDAFRNLFAYISGENSVAADISMTAPVLMEDKADRQNGVQISMTAPVLMNENGDGSVMSFVLPEKYTVNSAPKPTNPAVYLSERQDYRVAAIQFSGTLSDSNTNKHIKILRDWMHDHNIVAISQPIMASYNGPMTLPWWRKNDIIIEIK